MDGEDSFGVRLRRRVNSSCSMAKFLWNNMTVEPIIFFSVFSMGMGMVLQTNLVIDRVCEVDMDLPPDTCHHLDQHPDVQVKVQRTTNMIDMVQKSLSSIPGLFICLFLGPWSDAHGRKPLLVMPVLGATVMDIWLMIFAAFPTMGGWWSLGSAVYAFIGGGYVVFFTGAFSYITDISDAATRTARVALADFGIFAGIPLGIVFGGYIFPTIGYVAVFAIATAIRAACLVYVIFHIKETVGPHATYFTHQPTSADTLVPSSSPESTIDPPELLPLLHYSHVAKVFRTAFRNRPNSGRAVIVMLSISMVIAQSTMTSQNILFLYTRLKFNWTQLEFSEFTAAAASVAALGSVAVLPLLVKCGLRDTSLGMLGSMSITVSHMLLAFAKTWKWMFLVGSFAVFAGFNTIVIRSMISKVGEKHEVGSIFAMLSFLESAVPMFMAPALAGAYNLTIESFPGAVFVIIAGLNIIIFCLMLIIRWVSDPTPIYQTLDEEEEVLEEDTESTEGRAQVVI